MGILVGIFLGFLAYFIVRAILTGIAARVYLMQDNLTNQRKSYDGLKACEALSLGLTSGTRQNGTSHRVSG